MRRRRFTQPTRMIAGLMTGLLFAILAVPLGAQPASETRPGPVVHPVYDAAHEITVNGTIQQVVTKRTKGSPAGMHLIVAGPQGVVDTHIGPFLGKQRTAALHAGMPVRIVGATATVRGRNYLLARELTVDGSTITVRSKHGALKRVQATHGQRYITRSTRKIALNGGAR